MFADDLFMTRAGINRKLHGYSSCYLRLHYAGLGMRISVHSMRIFCLSLEPSGDSSDNAATTAGGDALQIWGTRVDSCTDSLLLARMESNEVPTYLLIVAPNSSNTQSFLDDIPLENCTDHRATSSNTYSLEIDGPRTLIRSDSRLMKPRHDHLQRVISNHVKCEQ